MLASGAAGLVCRRTGGGERMMCEGDRGMANVEIGLVDKEVMEGDFMKVALDVAGAGKFIDGGVTVIVDANGGDKSEEVVVASALSLLEGIAW